MEEKEGQKNLISISELEAHEIDRKVTTGQTKVVREKELPRVRRNSVYDEKKRQSVYH